MAKTYKKGTILRTDAALKAYMESTSNTMKFTSVELRRWWNPMRFFYGKVYYKII